MNHEFASLRSQYHSLHEKDREGVIELLAGMKEPAAARELMELYRECLWRSTRLKILPALSRNPNARSLEFLFRIARDPSDLPMAEAAIRALGQTHHPMAARFLVNLYRTCDDPRKPFVAGALGVLPDRTLASDFVADLKTAIEGRNFALIRNLVLTLGELHVREALPLLENLVLNFDQRPVVLSALLAIGKVARDPAFLEGVEHRFQSDAFEHQLFISARTQVRFRAQWRLEDYLSRIFQTAAFHRTLPYELANFAPADVREGLRLFASEPGHFERLCLALSRLPFDGMPEWYAEFLPLDALSDEQACLALESMSAHFDSGFLPLIRKFESRGEPVRARFLDALSLALPEADVAFSVWIDGPVYRSLDASGRIECLNALENFALSAQCRPARQTQVTRLLERLLDDESLPEVRARALRALGQLEVPSARAFQFVRERIQDPEFASSALLFLERCPVKDSLTILLQLAEATKGEGVRMLVRALRAQEKLPEKEDALDRFLARALGREAGNELRVEALGLVARHARRTHLKSVIECLKAGGAVRIAAVAALREIGDEAAADSLASFLEPPAKGPRDESLVGRTLDALLALPGLRARRLAVDFLREHADDAEVCEKIVRCLTPHPGAQPEYFVETIDGVLRKHPEHPLLDGLLALRMRFAEGALKSGVRSGVTGPDVAALDRELQKRIPLYDRLDEAARSALRAAETPFLHPEMFDESVDKSSSVLEYCKALDLVLERDLGRRHLFPKLESSLSEFQNVFHAVSLAENYPDQAVVMRALGVEGVFTPQSFPLHKMSMLAQSFLNGRILNDRLKTLDGLRAWAIVLLLFARRTESGLKPLIPLRGSSDEAVVKVSRRLIHLQEMRNPAAHRQTYPNFPTIEEVRREAIETLNQLQKLL